MRSPSLAACRLLYIVTAKSEAVKIAKSLLKEQLIACANILGPMQSLYRWKGRIEDLAEFLLLCKTTKKNFSAARKLIAKLHSYECPCIISLPIEDGNEKYLEWIRGSVLKALKD